MKQMSKMSTPNALIMCFEDNNSLLQSVEELQNYL